MPDTPQRIACDTSQKLSIRFGETIKGYLVRPELSISNLKVLPLVFALWLRYLMALGDDGNPFELSPDPLLEECRKYVSGIKLGDSDISAVAPLLHRKEIFGVDLFEAGLADIVKEDFTKLVASKGAVREVLKSL